MRGGCGVFVALRRLSPQERSDDPAPQRAAKLRSLFDRPAATNFCAGMLLLLFPATSHAQQTVSDSTGQQYRLIEANHLEMGAKRPDIFRVDHSDYNPAGDDQPIHPVILTSPFYIATSEVTRGQFKSFLADTGYEPTAVRNGSGIVGWDPVDNDRGQVKSSFRADPKFSWKNPGFAQTDSHPVVGFSFADATAYCDGLSNQEGVRYRLPTEAEWESEIRVLLRSALTAAF